MKQNKLIKSLLLLNFITSVLPGLLQQWTFELLEITSYSSDKNLLDFKAEVVRLNRANFGFNGFFNLSIDINDDVLFQATFERSFNRDGPYKKLPFGNTNETLTYAINKYYKPLVQSTADKCCINHPVVKNKFVPPLTKRNVVMNKCTFFTDNMPNILMEGYYRMRLTLFGPFVAYVESICYIENKIF